jgi:indole-3-glycerol phosphate synthase
MSYLQALLESTHARIADLRTTTSRAELGAAAQDGPPPLSLRDSLLGDDVAIIAEIKRATPRRGAIASHLDAGTAARSYAAGGASALSVLTDPHSFGGSLDDLRDAKAAGLPILRKDFILDEIQIVESRAAGADAVLLIVRILGTELQALVSACKSLGMDALVEVFDEADMQRANAAGASLIGINRRDLQTFELYPDRVMRLAPLADPRSTLVALSGVSTRADVTALGKAGVAAVLVGEALVTDADPARRIRTLRGAV